MFLAQDAIGSEAPDTMIHLIRHPDPLVRWAVARNPSLPATFRQPLPGDLDAGIRDAAERGLPTSMVKDYRCSLDQAREQVALPRDLRVLANSPYDTVWFEAARNPNTPAALLQEFAQNGAWPFLLAVLVDPSSPPSQRHALAQALVLLPDERARLVLTQHPDARWWLFER